MIRSDLDPAAASTTDPDANGLGVPGYWNSGPICTIFGPDAANHIQEEIARFITGEGIALDFSDKGQMASIFDNVSGPYGDGGDGSATISIATSLTRDVFYEDLTIDPGVSLNLAGRRLFVRGTLTLGDGSVISNNGADGDDYNGGGVDALGGAGALGFTVGGGGAGANGGVEPANVQAPDGGEGTPNLPSYTGYSGQGGRGGNGSPGGTEQTAGNGAAAPSTPFNARPTFTPAMQTGQLGHQTPIGTYEPFMMAGGGGGGGGGLASGATATDGRPGAGGGGGGVALVSARRILGPSAPDGPAFIQATGGDGGRDANSVVAPQGGGGGGGAGGTILLTSRTRLGDPGLLVLDVSGGAGGLSTVAGSGISGTSGSIFELFA